METKKITLSEKCRNIKAVGNRAQRRKYSKSQPNQKHTEVPKWGELNQLRSCALNFLKTFEDTIKLLDTNRDLFNYLTPKEKILAKNNLTILKNDYNKFISQINAIYEKHKDYQDDEEVSLDDLQKFLFISESYYSSQCIYNGGTENIHLFLIDLISMAELRKLKIEESVTKVHEQPATV